MERAIRRLGVEYPVVMDNDYRIWRAYRNRYWPAAYYVDHTGRIRYHHFGEEVRGAGAGRPQAAGGGGAGCAPRTVQPLTGAKP